MEDVEYFQAMPFSLAIPSHGVLVVHTGIVPGIPLAQQSLTDLINVRPPQHDPAHPATIVSMPRPKWAQHTTRAAGDMLWGLAYWHPATEWFLARASSFLAGTILSYTCI